MREIEPTFLIAFHLWHFGGWQSYATSLKWPPWESRPDVHEPPAACLRRALLTRCAGKHRRSSAARFCFCSPSREPRLDVDTFFRVTTDSWRHSLAQDLAVCGRLMKISLARAGSRANAASSSARIRYHDEAKEVHAIRSSIQPLIQPVQEPRCGGARRRVRPSSRLGARQTPRLRRVPGGAFCVGPPMRLRKSYRRSARHSLIDKW